MTSEALSLPGRDELLHNLHASLGSLVTAFVHNLNNNLVGVMGNIDLASLYPDNPEAITSKLCSARDASMRIKEFLVEFMRFRPVEGNFTPQSFNDVAAVAELACGRSMNLETTGIDQLPDHLPLSDLGFRALMLGLLSWAVRSCAVAGTVRIDITVNDTCVIFGVSWERADRSKNPPDPAPDRFPEWLKPVAASLGSTLEEVESSPSHGIVSFGIPRESA
jgi:hypothetical protein